MTVTVFSFVWCCLLLTIPAIAAFQCPSQTGSYKVADPDTKTGYYSCVNGVAKLQYCATGTYFSASSASCVAVPSAPGVNCNDGGYFQKPNPYDCTKFYKCDRGVAVPFDCPSGTHYNPTLHVCDWPDKAGCVAKQRPATVENTTNNSNQNSNSNNNNNNAHQNHQSGTTNNDNSNNNNNVEPIICPAYIEPGTSKLEPNPYGETGQTYYLCDSKGGVYLRFCPEGTRFNTGLGRCNEGKVSDKGGNQQDQSYHW